MVCAWEEGEGCAVGVGCWGSVEGLVVGYRGMRGRDGLSVEGLATFPVVVACSCEEDGSAAAVPGDFDIDGLVGVHVVSGFWGVVGGSSCGVELAGLAWGCEGLDESDGDGGVDGFWDEGLWGRGVWRRGWCGDVEVLGLGVEVLYALAVSLCVWGGCCCCGVVLAWSTTEVGVWAGALVSDWDVG